MQDIPSQAARKRRNRFSPLLCRNLKISDRMHRRMKNFRRIRVIAESSQNPTLSGVEQLGPRASEGTEGVL